MIGHAKKSLSRFYSGENQESFDRKTKVVYIKEVDRVEKAFERLSEKLQKLCIFQNTDGYFLLSAASCIDLIKRVAESDLPEVCDQKHYPNTQLSLEILKQTARKSTGWRLLGQANNYNIYLGDLAPSPGLSANCCAVMLSAERKRRGQKPFQSEKSIVRYFIEENQYEYLYYSIFEKCMCSGEMVFEDIVQPPIRLDAKNSEEQKMVIEFLKKRGAAKVTPPQFPSISRVFIGS
jgi:hypothetical protein